MKRFIVEDRREGEILLEGEIGVDGTLVVTEQADALEDDEIRVILDAIQQGVASGHTSGVVGEHGLEWFEKTDT